MRFPRSAWLVGLLTISAFLVPHTAGYPSYMIASSRCGDALEVGETIMGATATDSSRYMYVERSNGDTITSSGTYTAGEEFTVYLSSSGGRWVFEVDGGEFASGSNTGCSNTRRYGNSGTGGVTATLDGSQDTVYIWGGHASSYGTVQITEKLELTLAPDPTVQPTPAPTPAPSITPVPTSTNAPSPGPTTPQPSFRPTSMPTSKQNSSSSSSSASSTIWIIVGATVGGAIALVGSLVWYKHKGGEKRVAGNDAGLEFGSTR